MKRTPIEEFRVLTLNAWMLRLPFGIDLAKDVQSRFDALPEKLAQTNADIILLQEMWCPVQRRILAAHMAERGYHYSVTSGSSGRKPLHSTALTSMLTLKAVASVMGAGWFSGAGGHDVALALSGFALAGATVSTLTLDSIRNWMSNGLQIICKYPLSPSKATFSFTQHTRPDEFFVRKGVLHTQAHLPSLGWIDIYDTHLGAVTFDASHAQYDSWEAEMRSLQMKELLAFAQRRTASVGSIIGGDFNIHHSLEPGQGLQVRRSDEYQSILEMGLVDSYREKKGFGDSLECTDDSVNPYKQSGPFKETPCGVLDYIYYDRESKFQCVDAQTLFRDAPISDHYGVLSTFEANENSKEHKTNRGLTRRCFNK